MCRLLRRDRSGGLSSSYDIGCMVFTIGAFNRCHVIRYCDPISTRHAAVHCNDSEQVNILRPCHAPQICITTHTYLYLISWYKAVKRKRGDMFATSWCEQCQSLMSGVFKGTNSKLRHIVVSDGVVRHEMVVLPYNVPRQEVTVAYLDELNRRS